MSIGGAYFLMLIVDEITDVKLSHFLKHMCLII